MAKKNAYEEEDVVNALYDIFENRRLQREASRIYGEPQSTLSRRLKGSESLQSCNHSDWLISKLQEDRLVVWILRQESLGYSPSHGQNKTREQQHQKTTNNTNSLGCHWVPRFIKRRPEINYMVGW